MSGRPDCNPCNPCNPLAAENLPDPDGPIGHVELHQAWTWNCDRCGAENLHRGVRQPITDPETLQKLIDEGKASPGEPVDAIRVPSRVRCKACGAVFTSDLP